MRIGFQDPQGCCMTCGFGLGMQIPRLCDRSRSHSPRVSLSRNVTISLMRCSCGELPVAGASLLRHRCEGRWCAAGRWWRYPFHGRTGHRFPRDPALRLTALDRPRLCIPLILSEPNEPSSVRTAFVQIVCIQELSSATATNILAIRNRQVIGSSPIVGSTFSGIYLWFSLHHHVTVT
jgi:hypothetical protein